MAEAKAGEQDQSMEEILQSIKRIIAEEGDAAAPPSTSAPEQAPTPFGSDVLELTDMIADAPAAEEPAPAPKPAADPFDALFAAEPAPAIEPMPELKSAFPAPDEEPSIIEDSLLSEKALEASANALRGLANMGAPGATIPPVSASPHFRTGQTVEDLVVEALKPMLKEWLDANLPGIVDRKVQREVERISRELRSE